MQILYHNNNSYNIINLPTYSTFEKVLLCVEFIQTFGTVWVSTR